MAHRDKTKSPLVQSAVMQLLPRLAAFHTHTFSKHHLADSVTFILTNLKRDRQQTFLTLGYLAMALGESVKPQLSKIMEILRTTLRGKDGTTKKKAPPPDDAAYMCLCMLAR